MVIKMVCHCVCNQQTKYHVCLTHTVYDDSLYDEFIAFVTIQRLLMVCLLKVVKNLGANYKKILRLSYDVIITYDNRKSNLR